MTSEDIERIAVKATLAIDDEMRATRNESGRGALGYQWTRELMIRTVCEAAARAYEEAAQAVKAQCAEKGIGCLAHCTHPESAAAIRALKDKLQSEAQDAAKVDA